MTLELYGHPLSSFCQKVTMAFYEAGVPFVLRHVNLGDTADRAALQALWPIGKFPVLRDHGRDRTIPESTIIIEYLVLHHPEAARLIPSEPEAALETRLEDRFYDLAVNVPMQKVITDRLRPAGRGDPHGVEEAKALLRTAYGMIERRMAGRRFAMGEQVTMADCAAAPALFYAEMALPFGDAHANVAAYLARLKALPSFARVLLEAEPYLELVPR